MFLVQASARVAEHLVRQVVYDVVNSLGRNRALLRSTEINYLNCINNNNRQNCVTWANNSN